MGLVTLKGIAIIFKIILKLSRQKILADSNDHLLIIKLNCAFYTFYLLNIYILNTAPERKVFL